MGLRKLLGNNRGRYSIWQEALWAPEERPVTTKSDRASPKKAQSVTSTKQEQVTPAELDTSVLDTGPAELDSAVSESTTFRWEFGKKNGEAGAGNGVAGGVGSIGSRSSRIGSLGHQELDAGSESLSLRTTRSPSQSQAKIENEKPIEERQDGGKDKSSDATGSAETNQQLPGPEQSSTTSQPAIDKDLFIFSDDMDAIPGFGRQFGIAPTSIIREQEAKEAENPEPEPEPEPRTEPEQTAEVKGKGKDFESFFQQVDEELEALYTDYLSLSGKQNAKPKFSWKPGFIGATSAKSYTKAVTGEDACIICLEPFASSVLAPPTVTMACQHPPSVCYGCLAKSIKHDLETKFWDEIKCPECKVLFTHEDVKKFADEATFERYDKLSFRHAVSADKNFIWCLECDFGQLHEPGATQPQVRCLKCSAVSCFKHAIKWHDEFTCDEYDAVLWDPDSYKEIKAKNAAKGKDANPKPEAMSKGSMKRAKRAEQFRQQQLHQAQKKAAKERQEKEAKEAKQKKENIKDDFKEKLEQLKKRKEELEKSEKVVEKTTKRCPGCRWPIEKNDGCDHMTCIKCRHEFCWLCLGEWRSHTRNCRRLGLFN
ncbi:hypothetical protein ASPCAL06777 [Aspergillus calidoustus]|uniref:RBR-type E3 ubiquitin transferase n=1 Tax=Aspergillus calidoustus TaxID=454130 RepID=A0A0U5C9G1_ASPCI|nr:hypothetical protein ASPCAL06777 [Aspergillus calidoustus]